jgi:hypothetical protein
VATAVAVSYSVPAGGALRAGTFDVALSGGISLADLAPTGILGSNASTVSGSVLLDNVAPTGTLDGGYSVPSGAITNISLNHRDDVNPRSNAAFNPNAPSAAPWEASVGWGASALSAFCGALFCGNWGPSGKYVMWGAPGHSTNLEYAGWVAFDVAARQWQIVNASPPVPTQAALPPTSQCDQAYGEWNGNSADWVPAFRRPGYNPPFGGHTRNSLVYIPAAAAGNTNGKIIVGWSPTLNNTGLGIAGGWVYDCDTGLFSRTTNARPGTGSAVGGICYHATQNVVIGYNSEFSSTVSHLDYLDLATMTWTRRNATASVVIGIDSSSFVVGDLYIYAANTTTGVSFRAAPVSTVKAGGSWAWANLTLSTPASLPLRTGGLLPGMLSCQWERCPVNGAWYAVNRNSGSLTLWKLQKPAGVADSDTAGLLSGSWTITSETLTGTGLEPAQYDYQRLQWCDALSAFLWTGDLHTSAVQAIRPVGV